MTVRGDLALSEAARGDGTADPTLDPRIAATGGRRRTFGRAKANYEWLGMMAEADWRKTRVHQHTSYYGCGRCGTRFATPQAVYAHLARRHGR